MFYSEAAKILNDEHLCMEFATFICGDKIGSGCFRDVYEYNLDPKCVVKIQRDLSSFNNIMEWEIWCNVLSTEYKKHFAPCVLLSCNGRILIQRKTNPITDEKPAPNNIPHFFTDIKNENFGWIGKDFVAHDYDYSMMKFISGGLNNKTRKFKT